MPIWKKHKETMVLQLLSLHHYPHQAPDRPEVPLCLGALGGAIKVHLDEGITAGTHHTWQCVKTLYPW